MNYKGYIEGIYNLLLCLRPVGYLRLALSAVVGLVSKLFYLVAFVCAIKFISEAVPLKGFFGDYYALIGVSLVSAVLVAWLLSNYFYGALIKRIEHIVSSSLLSKFIRYQVESFDYAADKVDKAYKDEHKNSVLIYPKKLSKLAVALFSVMMLVPVVVLLLGVLAYLNMRFTLFLLLMLSLVSLFIPSAQKKVRIKKLDMELARQDVKRDLMQLNLDLFKNNPRTESHLEYSSVYSESFSPELEYEMAEKYLSSILDAFTMIVIISLVAWTLFNEATLGRLQMSEMIVYLIAARFFCSYINQLLKQLSIVNSGLVLLDRLKLISKVDC